VRVLDKWNVEKTRFEPANEPVEAGFSLRILLFVLIVTHLSGKNAIEKLDFTLENVINCVRNEPDLWNVRTSILKYCTYRLWNHICVCL